MATTVGPANKILPTDQFSKALCFFALSCSNKVLFSLIKPNEGPRKNPRWVEENESSILNSRRILERIDSEPKDEYVVNQPILF